jgi:hypothetical protein
VKLDSRAGSELIDRFILAGAAVAPFNFMLGIQISGLYLRPLHLWAFGAGLILVAVYRRALLSVIDGAVLAFWAMLAFVVLSTLFATPAEYRFRGIADAALLSLNVTAFTVVKCYYDLRPNRWLSLFNVLAVSSVAMSLVMIAQALLTASGGQVLGVGANTLGLGTVAGTYTSTFAAAATAAMVFATDRRGFFLALGAFVIHGTAALLSLARGPWLAFAVAVLVIVPLAAWRFRGRFTVVGTAIRGGSIAIALPTLGGLVFLLSPFVRKLLTQRFVELVQTDAGTGSARLNMWREFLRDGFRSPLFGHGAAAYREISESLGVKGTVSENFVVEIFHAGGGVAVFLLIVALSSVMLRCLLPPGAARRPAHTAACITGAAALIMASTTNPAAWNGLFWLILGLTATRPISEEVTAVDRVPTRRRVTQLATGGAAAP